MSLCMNATLTRVGGMDVTMTRVGDIECSATRIGDMSVSMTRVGGMSAKMTKIGGRISCAMYQVCTTNFSASGVETKVLTIITRNDVAMTENDVAVGYEQ